MTPPLRPPPPLLSLSSSLHLDGRWPAARGMPSPSRPPSNPAVSGPEMGDPEVGGSALREMVSASLPPPEEGRVENLLFPFVFVPPLAPRSLAVPTFSIKEQFPISLGHKRARLAVCDVLQTPCHPLPPLSSPAVSGVWFEDITSPSLTPAAPPWDQVSVAQLTQTPLRAASVPPELSPCVPPRCPTPGTSVVPLVPLARCLGAWLALPSPSRWLILTIRLG